MIVSEKITPYRELPLDERVIWTLPNFSPLNSQEDQVLAEAELFRKLATQAWGLDTIYPGDAAKYAAEKPLGQCGATIGGFAVWLVWREIVLPSQLTFNRGKIVDEDGESVGEHHAHLLLDLESTTGNDLRMSLDLTADQFSRIEEEGSVFYPDYGPELAMNGSQGENLTHVVEKFDLFAEYDTGKFDWRMIDFLGHFYNKPTLRNIGHRAIRGDRNDLWLPRDSKHSRDEIFDRLEAVQPKLELPKSMIKPAGGKKVPRHSSFTRYSGGNSASYTIHK